MDTLSLPNAALFALILLTAASTPALASSSHIVSASANGPIDADGTTDKLADLRLPDGRTQRVLIVRPSRPTATIVMLPGGDGDIGIERDGDLRHDRNFVVRTRMLWAARGYAVVIPDAVDDANLRGLRSAGDYATLIGHVVAFAHDTVKAPVFLLGTSQGAIAAMNGAAHARRGAVAGLVLTESVSVRGGSGETVFDADPEAVRVPALVVANRDDRCKVAPPSLAPKIAAAMTASPDVRVIYVSGGRKQSDSDCGSLTPHGYDGIEEAVVGRIADWLDAHRG